MLKKILLAHLLASVVLFCVAEAPWPGLATPAWADDDDDDGSNDNGGDNDDDDDDSRKPSASHSGGSKEGLSRLFRRAPAQPQQVPRAASRSAPVPPPPEQAAAEIVTNGLSSADLTTLESEGYQSLEVRQLARLGTEVRRLSIPPGVSLTDARMRVGALSSVSTVDFNHYYRTEQGFAPDCQGGDCPARLSIGWPLPPSRSGCGSGVAIGMIDTGINDAHETFAGAALELHRLSDDGLTPSRNLHGTAIAALLIGDPATRSPGLVPGASLVAVDSFHREGRDERADVFTLTDALSFLAERDVRVINLSLAGPENAVLEEITARLVAENDILILAAAGNDGPRAGPRYPAAFDHVMAVTAIDRDRRVYRRAVQGPHIDLAAPGVNVWTAASVSGARWKTGTSFAVPFATAAAAMLRETHPESSAIEIAEALRAGATDLGEPGRDEVYGHGLVPVIESCGSPLKNQDEPMQ
ncbi:S8 family serine peptidase [Celeribacter persicus]|uniref:Subtilase family protein n=1 Tax=Celeribacter persicus TaxID=1651082 RepID=A0A2T5HSR4_9RHOB|nr:S8 family serine peptidase [Celeribacter persicus]PTQ74604.1 subtilase family protein [Celeribacter persicus]